MVNLLDIIIHFWGVRGSARTKVLQISRQCAVCSRVVYLTRDNNGGDNLADFGDFRHMFNRHIIARHIWRRHYFGGRFDGLWHIILMPFCFLQLIEQF